MHDDDYFGPKYSDRKRCLAKKVEGNHAGVVQKAKSAAMFRATRTNIRGDGRGRRAADGIDVRLTVLEVNPRGQGPRGYGSAARRLPAFEARDAGGVTPCTLR